MKLQTTGYTGRLMQAAMIGSILLACPAFADLPGLPAPQDNTSTTGATTANSNVRPEKGQRAPLAEPTPVRGSLFRQGAVATPAASYNQPGAETRGPPLSFTAVQAPEPRKYRKNDVVTVVVQQDSESNSTGTADSKKTQDFDMAIQQFLQLALSQSGIPTVGTVNAPSKLPEIKFNYTNDRQSDASQQRSDTMSLRLSGTIVDVKPNGTLVVEATAHINVDKEQQDYKLSGICRVADIAADNTILSTQLANLSIDKQTKGEVRDGTRRGWLNKLIDQFSPF